MFDVSELVSDTDFAQTFTLYRSTGNFVAGRWVENARQTLTRTGVIIVMSARELQMLPEADRVIGSIEIHTKEILYTTTGEGTNRTSDQILWKSNLYKLILVNDYADFGFYKAVGQRIAGD
jgi:hypothetical protein